MHGIKGLLVQRLIRLMALSHEQPFLNFLLNQSFNLATGLFQLRLAIEMAERFVPTSFIQWTKFKHALSLLLWCLETGCLPSWSRWRRIIDIVLTIIVIMSSLRRIHRPSSRILLRSRRTRYQLICNLSLLSSWIICLSLWAKAAFVRFSCAIVCDFPVLHKF